MTTPRATAASSAAVTGIWIALIAGLAVFGSFAFACAAPFAAIAALAALTMRRAEGLALVVVAWLANQAVGFILLGYAHTADSYAWGAAIGIAAVLGYFAASVIAATTRSALVASVTAFLSAFAAYQAALYAFGLMTSYAGDGFSAAIVTEVLTINAVAFAAFLVVHRAAVALTLAPPAPRTAITA